MPLIDAANVEELAAVCAQLSRYSFLLAVVPPRILGMTRIPLNPRHLLTARHGCQRLTQGKAGKPQRLLRRASHPIADPLRRKQHTEL